MSEAGRPYPPEGLPPLGPPAWPAAPPPPPPPGPRWWRAVVAIGVLAVAIAAVVTIALVAGDDDDDRGADAPSRPAATDGDAFTDPQGSYTLTLGPEWTDLPSTMVAEIETWAVAEGDSGFTPNVNVNVLTQDAPDMDGDEYMDLTLESLASIDGEVIDHAFVTGSSGRSLGLLEYVAQPPGVNTDLHFIAVFDLQGATAVVATYTATPEQFDELRASVEPYLLTLEAAG
jgi:hypothetical protein